MAASGVGGTWDSALSADGFAAIRSVGFEPVGQVFGVAVYYLSAIAGVSCPGSAARELGGPSPEAPGRSQAMVSGQGIPGPAGRIAQALYHGRRTAIDRMAGECADRGGHGIVGAAVQVREIPAGSVVVSALTVHLRSDACRARSGGTDHFAEAVITGTAVARFAERRTSARPPSLAVLPLG
jgi:uncharacterized protein YbjQ (UPF0145 family)